MNKKYQKKAILTLMVAICLLLCACTVSDDNLQTAETQSSTSPIGGENPNPPISPDDEIPELMLTDVDYYFLMESEIFHPAGVWFTEYDASFAWLVDPEENAADYSAGRQKMLSFVQEIVDQYQIEPLTNDIEELKEYYKDYPANDGSAHYAADKLDVVEAWINEVKLVGISQDGSALALAVPILPDEYYFSPNFLFNPLRIRYYSIIDGELREFDYCISFSESFDYGSEIVFDEDMRGYLLKEYGHEGHILYSHVDIVSEEKIDLAESHRRDWLEEANEDLHLANRDLREEVYCNNNASYAISISHTAQYAVFDMVTGRQLFETPAMESEADLWGLVFCELTDKKLTIYDRYEDKYRIFDIYTGEETILELPYGAFSPDGKYLAYISHEDSGEQTLSVLEIETGKRACRKIIGLGNEEIKIVGSIKSSLL